MHRPTVVWWLAHALLQNVFSIVWAAHPCECFWNQILQHCKLHTHTHTCTCTYTAATHGGLRAHPRECFWNQLSQNFCIIHTELFVSAYCKCKLRFTATSFVQNPIIWHVVSTWLATLKYSTWGTSAFHRQRVFFLCFLCDVFADLQIQKALSNVMWWLAHAILQNVFSIVWAAHLCWFLSLQ